MMASQRDWDSAVAYLKILLPRLGLESEADWMRFARNTYREGEGGILHFDWDVRLARPLAKAGGPPPDLWRLFHALGEFPVAAIRGENSDVLAPETFARMAEALPQMTTVTIPGKGHAPTLEEGPAADAIDDVLERAAE